MTKLLDEAVDVARRMSPNAQDAIARFILDVFNDDASAEPLPPEHREAILEGLAQAERGEFASHEEVAEAFRSFRR
ncbi:hypothetical protein [Methylopila sp. 73B]|uniref:hypothetical protein n=1 Tax=Methylopila sp. 73B TaxID=1120792 RepID=UPI00037A82B6|nr:hypothetical protein [Methylopila sp. 73B]